VHRKSVRFVVVGRAIVVRSAFIAVVLYHFIEVPTPAVIRRIGRQKSEERKVRHESQR
jgi:peptidoglycan/LPS O-acetylase OafA/YrhL